MASKKICRWIAKRKIRGYKNHNVKNNTRRWGKKYPYVSLVGTYLLTPWCRVLLEKLTGLQLVKKFPAFHGTRRFITALKRVRHLSLFWASSIQSIYPHPTSWRSTLILSTHLRLGLPSVLLPSQSCWCCYIKSKDMKILQIIGLRMSAVKWNVPETCFRLLRETLS